MNWLESEDKTWVLHNAKAVQVIAEIRKNETGEVREYFTDEILSDMDEYPSDFNWSENNYSCDCNRELFFERAVGGDPEIDVETACTDGKYSVNLKNKKDGEYYYKEF